MRSGILCVFIAIALLKPAAKALADQGLVCQNSYHHFVQSYPIIQLDQKDLDEGLLYTQEIARSFLTEEQLKEFTACFKQDLPKGCCLGTSLLLAVKEPITTELSFDEKMKIIYFQSYVSLMELMKIKWHTQDESLLSYMGFFEQIEKDIHLYFSDHHKKLVSLIPSKILERNKKSDEEFDNEVIDGIIDLVKNEKVQSILFHVGYKSRYVGHTILVHLRGLEIYDQVEGHCLYASKADLILDLLRYAHPLCDVEKIWMSSIENN